MSKGESAPDLQAWVPSGLKVRAAAPKAEPKPKADRVPVSVLDTIPAMVVTDSPRVNERLEEHPTNRARRSTDLPNSQPANSGPIEPPKRGFRPMPIFTLFTLISLAILFSLGKWQWDKYVLKTNATTAQVEVVEPVSVMAALEATDPEYRPVIVDGLLDQRVIKIGVVQQGVRGYRLFAPVIMEAGGIFVDFGFVAEDATSRISLPTGQVRLQGVLRTGAKSSRYTPDNDPKSDTWYWPDITAMADMLVIQTAGSDFYVAQSDVDPMATGTPTPNPYADKGGAAQVAPGTHLGYALQWWGFGLALIGVYMGLHIRSGRLRLRRTVST